MQHHYDIAIVGGGPVGASLAISLSTLPVKLALIEAVVPTPHHEPAIDGRSIALSLSSQRILHTIGVWPALQSNTQLGAQQKIAAIKTVHVSQKGRFGATRIHAKDEGVESLGAVVPMSHLLSGLNQKLGEINSINLIRPSKVLGLTHESSQQWQIALDNQSPITAKLLIAADGTNSCIRSLCGIETQQQAGEHSAIVANIEMNSDLSPALQTTAYERFIPGGAVALLPVAHSLYTLIWVGDTQQANGILALGDETFLTHMQTLFGYRLGRFLKLGKRWSYPLQSIQAKQQVQQGLVLIGNAAHTLHPIAAQGFNLGLRDVACLAETIANALSNNKDISDLSLLQQYQQLRLKDQERVMRLTDRLKHFDHLPFKLVSGVSLLAIDLIPPLKHRFAKLAMGLIGPVPALARGIEL